MVLGFVSQLQSFERKREGEREMAGSGSGDGAKENDDLRLYKNLTREAGHELEDFGEFKGKREMDLCGSGDGAKVSKLVSEENQPRISEMEFADRFLQSYADDDWTCSDSDYSDGEDDVYYFLCVILSS